MDESAYDYALVESELANSMKQILDYSQIDEKEASRFTLMVSQYMNLPDRNTSDNDVRKLEKILQSSSIRFMKMFSYIH